MPLAFWILTVQSQPGWMKATVQSMAVPMIETSAGCAQEQQISGTCKAGRGQSWQWMFKRLWAQERMTLLFDAYKPIQLSAWLLTSPQDERGSLGISLATQLDDGLYTVQKDPV